ncbi:MAG: TIGR03905 family TSCPD domain-containing protein [Kiritimatiellae bacterium]|nr:TIGR03905 family TSCPD domain-containing protein [Kiritimatiellia bacterium]
MKTVRLSNTCAQSVTYEIVDNRITVCAFSGGCPGNTQGVARLVIGRTVDEVIALLKGIQCRNGTSCPDQFARALEADRAEVSEATGL